MERKNNDTGEKELTEQLERPGEGQMSSVAKEAPYPPPQRACLICNQEAWVWIGEQYACGSGGPEHGQQTRDSSWQEKGTDTADDPAT